MTSWRRDGLSLAVFAAAVIAVTTLVDSGVVLTFVVMALYAALLAQTWNLLGGYGGQFSFGHAVFFGTGAYVQAIAQLQGGLPAWAALPLAVAAASAVALAVGALAFRYGLKEKRHCRASGVPGAGCSCASSPLPR